MNIPRENAWASAGRGSARRRRGISAAGLLLLIAILFSPPVLSAQSRPRVGLALSGGAAKGFAHIGVLRVLEEVGLPPDYITGTSMGSIVGGLYAMGYPADSLRQLAREMDWDRVLSDNISLYQVIFEEKTYFKNELLELPIREGKVKQPSGLIQGQQIEEMLNRLTLPAYAIEDFDLLPYPFRCMAADIVTGRPVEISRGALPDALRASMAIPTIFTPVYRDSMVLVDGGLIRNFPVQELVPMGADIIIGVYVGAKPEEEGEKLSSITQILYQIAFMQSVEDYDRQMPLVDIYIEPDLTGYGVQSFSSVDSIIARGERAARAQYGRLRALADSLNTLGPPPAHPPLPPVSGIRIDRTEVTGNRQVTDEEIIGQTGLRPGRVVTADDLKEALEYLYGANRYQKVNYRLRRSGNDNVLVLHAQEKTPYLLKTSLIYDSYHEAGLAFNVTLRNLLLDASRLMVIGRIADNYRYRVEYLKYLDRGQTWFFNATVQYNRDGAPSLRDGRVVEQFRLRDLPIDLMVNRRIGRNVLLGMGGQFEFLSLRPTISTEPVFRSLEYQNFNVLFQLQTNSLDRNVLPRRGARLLLETKFVTGLGYRVNGLSPLVTNPDSLFRFDPYFKFSFRSENYLPLTPSSSLILSPFAGLLGTSDIPITDFYLLGAPEALTRRSIPFFGLEANEAIVQTVAGADVGVQVFPRDNLLFAINLSAGLFGQPNPNSARTPLPDRFVAGAGLTAAYNTILGPVKFTVMYPLSTAGDLRRSLKTFLSFGHRF